MIENPPGYGGKSEYQALWIEPAQNSFSRIPAQCRGNTMDKKRQFLFALADELRGSATLEISSFDQNGCGTTGGDA